jgi:hypothetical protein
MTNEEFSKAMQVMMEKVQGLSDQELFDGVKAIYKLLGDRALQLFDTDKETYTAILSTMPFVVEVTRRFKANSEFIKEAEGVSAAVVEMVTDVMVAQAAQSSGVKS